MLELLDKAAEAAIQDGIRALADAGAGPNERMHAMIRMNRAARRNGGAMRMDIGRGVVVNIPAERKASDWWIRPEGDQ